MKKIKKEISIKEMMYSNKGAHNTIISFKDHLDTFEYEGKDYEDDVQVSKLIVQKYVSMTDDGLSLFITNLGSGRKGLLADIWMYKEEE